MGDNGEVTPGSSATGKSKAPAKSLDRYAKEYIPPPFNINATEFVENKAPVTTTATTTVPVPVPVVQPAAQYMPATPYPPPHPDAQFVPYNPSYGMYPQQPYGYYQQQPTYNNRGGYYGKNQQQQQQSMYGQPWQFPYQQPGMQSRSLRRTDQ